MTPEEKAYVEEVKEREREATPLPWHCGEGDPKSENLVADIRGIEIFGPYKAVSCGAEADFILNARTDIPRLVQIIERQEGVIEKAKEMAAFYLKFFGVDPAAFQAHEFMEMLNEI